MICCPVCRTDGDVRKFRIGGGNPTTAYVCSCRRFWVEIWSSHLAWCFRASVRKEYADVMVGPGGPRVAASPSDLPRGGVSKPASWELAGEVLDRLVETIMVEDVLEQ